MTSFTFDAVWPPASSPKTASSQEPSRVDAATPLVQISGVEGSTPAHQKCSGGLAPHAATNAYVDGAQLSEPAERRAIWLRSCNHCGVDLHVRRTVCTECGQRQVSKRDLREAAPPAVSVHGDNNATPVLSSASAPRPRSARVLAYAASHPHPQEPKEPKEPKKAAEQPKEPTVGVERIEPMRRRLQDEWATGVMALFIDAMRGEERW